MVLFGQASGRVAPLDPQVLNQKGSLYLTSPTLGAYTLTREELLAAPTISSPG
jgi:NADPH:quinone reductase